MSGVPACSGGMDTDDDDAPITPELLADDDDLREALAAACEPIDRPTRTEIDNKLSYLKANLDEGLFAILTELVEAITQRHEEVVFTVVRDVLWSWAESDAANGVGPSS
ncbi:MAG: hypothetical protein HYV09_10775 [Deltaproteobacteria bacterium]|nr:hypothetical protein [Deltaproteobacteria bacterium]